MDRYLETFETWNSMAARYEAKFMDLALYNASYDRMCDAIQLADANLLEIGCGPGNIAKYVLAQRPEYQLHGIDVSPNMVALAQKNNPNAHFEVMDCRTIGSLNASFDGIICGFCVPYLSEIECSQLMIDCYALLNPNGVLYLSFVAGDPALSGFQINSEGKRSYFYYHSMATLKQSLMSTGFALLNVLEVAYPKSAVDSEIHTIVIAQKSGSSI